MSKPFFSVVIPTYMRTETLFDTVRSVLAQEHSDYELLIIDDGSTAEVRREIRQFLQRVDSDGRIQFIALEKNFGGAAARNVGIEAAVGCYIAFLDSDDVWSPRKLKADYEALSRYDGIDLAYSPIENIKDGRALEKVPSRGIRANESIGDYIFAGIKGGRGMQTSTLVVRATLAKEVKFNAKLRGHQDWDFLLRLAQKRPRIHFIEVCGTVRLLSSDNGRVGHKNISRGLSYDFSRQFLEEYSRYMSGRAKCFFRTRVLLKKSVLERKELLQNLLYPGNILDAHYIIKMFISKFLRKSGPRA